LRKVPILLCVEPKVTGDTKLKGEGAAEKAAGKVQNAGGGVKDAIRGKKEDLSG
jgi:uncharacterized protein YjbJ (UPF0337 family)